jgi:hypothetical protein
VADEDDVTPPRLPIARALPKPRRPGSHWDDDQRATVGRKTPPYGAPIPEPINWDELTDRYEGDELDRMRSMRPTPYKVRKLERDVTALTKDVAETKTDVAVIGVETKAQTKMLERLLDDQADAVKTRRERVTKLIGGAVALLTGGGFLHWLMGRL